MPRKPKKTTWDTAIGVIEARPTSDPEIAGAFNRGLENVAMDKRYVLYFETGESPYATLLTYRQWLALPANQRPGGPA